MEKSIRIDDRLESYQSFFDHAWSRNLEQIAQHTKLDTPAFELSASWKGVANVRRMPWLMVDSIKNFGDSLLSAKMPFPLEVLDMVVARIASTSKDNYFRHLSTMQRNTLTKVIRESQDEAIKTREENPVTVNKEDLWKGLLQSTEIQLTLWMSEMTAYAGVYFAYEAFLIKSMKIALNLQSLRSGDGQEQLAGKLSSSQFQGNLTKWGN